MNILCSDGQSVSFGDISYSPFLLDLMECTECHEDGYWSIDRFDSNMMMTYGMFLSDGVLPDMTEELSDMLAYMGHVNGYGYPLDYWRIKLRDNWIRDHMYKLSLYDDPHYGLMRLVPTRNPLNIYFPEGAYIAGGYPLWLAGQSSDYGDIDVFFTSKDALQDLVYSNGSHMWSVNIYEHVVQVNARQSAFSDILTPQCITRLYKAPTEILHGFDLDCCGILWDGKDLWATERAMYSMANKINWVDPERASPSYAHRLGKYMTRGYEIGLVDINRITIDESRVLDLWNAIHGVLQTHVNVKPYERFGQYLRMAFSLKRPDDVYITNPNGYEVNQSLQNRRRSIRRYLPTDPGSILLLASTYKMYTAIWTSYDYITRAESSDVVVIESDGNPHDLRPRLDDIVWQEQDPMAQVSSTRHPTPLRGLSVWWEKSPLVNDRLPWPLMPKPKKIPIPAETVPIEREVLVGE